MARKNISAGGTLFSKVVVYLPVCTTLSLYTAESVDLNKVSLGYT